MSTEETTAKFFLHYGTTDLRAARVAGSVIQTLVFATVHTARTNVTVVATVRPSNGTITKMPRYTTSETPVRNIITRLQAAPLIDAMTAPMLHRTKTRVERIRRLFHHERHPMMQTIEISTEPTLITVNQPIISICSPFSN
jgi:tRNA splicing endonuclease